MSHEEDTKKRATLLAHLMQFSDAMFPVGTFSFSNGLETAAYEKSVHDSRTLEEYSRSAALQAAYSDGVAAPHAHRAAARDDYESVVEADRYLMLFKMNDETRLMLERMGKKLAELADRLFPTPLIRKWLADIKEGITPGTYPVAQGLVFQAAGLSEQDLYSSHQYGIVNMIVGAALRCVRVSHYDTQEILYKLAGDIPEYYRHASAMRLEDMNCFVPEIDIFSSLHEKGNMRMFMS